jgi:signal transduction histidine kinase
MTRSRDIFYATLAFVRIDTAEQCQLWDTLDPIIALLAVRAQKENIHLEVNIPRISLYAQPTVVQQIILNLLTNAMDAVRELPPADRTVKIWVHHEPASPFVQIKVSNQGLPIVGEIKSQLFKRGFTTKGAKGSGFGLYLSRKLAQKNQGELFLDETAQETCFVVELKIGESQRGMSELYKKAG